MQKYTQNDLPLQPMDCLYIPSSLINSDRYRNMGTEAIIIYAHLLDTCGLVRQTGPEPVALHLPDIDLEEICRATVIKRQNTVQALKRLMDSGLLFLDNKIPA